MRKQQQARNLSPLPPPIIEGDQAETVEDGLLRPSRIRRQSHDRCRQKICFVCEVRGDETLPYNNGGVGRCEMDSAIKRLKDSKDKLLECNSTYTAAAERLNILILGCNEDAFAADVYYHKQCYNKFTSVLVRESRNTEETDSDAVAQVLSLFLRNVEIKIIADQDAFLLHEICQDCKEISAEFGLNDTPPSITSFIPS